MPTSAFFDNKYTSYTSYQFPQIVSFEEHMICMNGIIAVTMSLYPHTISVFCYSYLFSNYLFIVIHIQLPIFRMLAPTCM